MSEFGFICKCNHCDHIFPEQAIIYDKEQEIEFCPECNGTGAIMDLGEAYEFGTDNEIFHFLSQCRDWNIIKSSFSLENLCDFENEIHDYLYYKNGYENLKEGFPVIINWYEGNINTEDLIKEYRG